MRSRITIRACSKRAKWVMLPTVVLAGVNFATFIIANVYLGGDALNGYVRVGHYFVCAHGSCTEVSSAVWHYSYWHALTAMGGMFLIFAEAAVFINTGDIEWE